MKFWAIKPVQTFADWCIKYGDFTDAVIMIAIRLLGIAALSKYLVT